MPRLVLANVWGKSIYPSLGLLYIASYLKKYGGFEDIFIVETTQKEALAEIKKTKPDIVAFGATTPAYNATLEIAKLVKEETGATTTLGGTHISSLPKTLPEFFDFGIIGEGEQTFLELIQLLDSRRQDNKKTEKIDGLTYHLNGTVKITNSRKLIEPLDRIPFPARELVDMGQYLKPTDILCTHESLRGTSMITSRGCPYKCIYCQASQHWNRIRMNSAEYVVEEIKLLKEKYNVEAIAVVDDLFIADRKRVAKIVEGLKKDGLNEEIKFMVDGRANLIDEEILKLLKEMNVVEVAIGFESGSDRMLKYLKKDSVTMKQNMDCIEKIKNAGMGIYGQFMVGSPGETREDILATKKLMENPAITTAHVSVTTPLPGTELWDYCVKEKIVGPTNINWKKFNMDAATRGDDAIYVNKDMPFEEFLGLYRQCVEVSLMKAATAKGALNARNIIGALKKPKTSARIAAKILKQKVFGKAA